MRFQERTALLEGLRAADICGGFAQAEGLALFRPAEVSTGPGSARTDKLRSGAQAPRSRSQ